MKLVEIEQDTTEPRFGRLKTVERLFGLKRGTCYNLLRLRKIRGCSICVTSKRSRTRVIDLDSVRQFLEQEMEAQNGGKNCEAPQEALHASSENADKHDQRAECRVARSTHRRSKVSAAEHCKTNIKEEAR